MRLGANPAVESYNASPVKINNATSSTFYLIHLDVPKSKGIGPKFKRVNHVHRIWPRM
jgi:hypothetical protein